MPTLEKVRRSDRGTKRICPACEVRFYDLLRERFACPSCGAQHALSDCPDELQVENTQATKAEQPGWRSGARGGFSSRPVPVAASVQAVASSDETSEPGEEAEPAEDTLLEEDDTDETSVDDLIDRDDEEPEEV